MKQIFYIDDRNLRKSIKRKSEKTTIFLENLFYGMDRTRINFNRNIDSVEAYLGTKPCIGIEFLNALLVHLQ